MSLSGTPLQREAVRRSVTRQIIRFLVTLAVMTVIQAALEYLIFNEVGPNLQITRTLESFDPSEVGKQWLEALGLFQHPAGERASGCNVTGQIITKCDLVEPDNIRVSGSFALFKSVWSVLTRQFSRDRSPESRLFALCQILLGALSALAILGLLFSRPNAPDIPPYLIVVAAIFGTFAMSVILAYPLRWLALQLIPVAAVYSAAVLFCLNKLIDAVMDKLVESAIEAV
jgi:ABC-type Na+ efflux pump permease subunit